MEPDVIVYIVDDDEAARHSLGMLMESVEITAKSYSSAMAFLEDFDSTRPGCLVLDIRMPRMSGLDLQQELNKWGITIPVIFITGHGDVPLAVRAMKDGAMDFFEKPFRDHDLLDSISHALAKSVSAMREEKSHASFLELADNLSPREKEVMAMLVAGKCSKTIASLLGISPKTVHVHRGHIMEKMGVRSVVELVHLATSNKPKGVTC